MGKDFNSPEQLLEHLRTLSPEDIVVSLQAGNYDEKHGGMYSSYVARVYVANSCWADDEAYDEKKITINPTDRPEDSTRFENIMEHLKRAPATKWVIFSGL